MAAGSSISVTPGAGAKVATGPTYTESANVVQDQKVIAGEAYLPTYVAGTTAGISTATANSHIYQLMAGASLNLYIRRITIYQAGLATTAAILQWNLLRLTTAGTGGTVHGTSALDSADSAAGATAMDLPTVKGTEGAFLGGGTSMFIQTVPTGGPAEASLMAEWDFEKLRGKALRIPAGVANGLCIKNLAAIAGATVIAIIYFSEASF